MVEELHQDWGTSTGYEIIYQTNQMSKVSAQEP